MISSNKLVEACLCVYDHPAWITDSLGTVIAKNDAADHLNIEGLNLSQTILYCCGCGCGERIGMCFFKSIIKIF